LKALLLLALSRDDFGATIEPRHSTRAAAETLVEVARRSYFRFRIGWWQVCANFGLLRRNKSQSLIARRRKL
jgi:hypothetical protein